MRFLKNHFGDGRAVTAPPADSSVPRRRRSDARLDVALWGADLGLWETDFRSDTTVWASDWCRRLDLDPVKATTTSPGGTRIFIRTIAVP